MFLGKGVCHPWSMIVLLIYMHMDMTEKPRWGLPGSFRAALTVAGALPLELMLVVFVHNSFTHLVSSEPLLKKACSCPARLLHNRLLHLQLLFPSHPLWSYTMGHRQGIYSRRRRTWDFRKDFIPVYQGKERKYRILTWVGKPYLQNAQICSVSDFVTPGSGPGGGMDFKVIM